MKWFTPTVRFAEDTSNPIAQRAYKYVAEQGWVPAESPSATEFPATELQLVTWNVDSVGDQPGQRLMRIMLHLRKRILDGTPPSCILLQEVHEDAIPALLRYSWIRDHFLVTPINNEGWTVPHGLVTLVSKTVPVSTVFAVNLPRTAVGRQALFVDVHLSAPQPDGEGDDKPSQVRTLRVANTHLEPGTSGARARPKQLETIARLLNVSNVDAQICAGSMCSFRDSDKTAPSQAGFADAFRGLQKDGMTWGVQARGEKPPCRLDKVLHFPTEQVEIHVPKRIGLKVMMKDGRSVSDHCGLSATIKVLRGN